MRSIPKDKTDFALSFKKSAALLKTREENESDEIFGADASHYEKCDAISRLNEFVSILREELGEAIGASVYIIKDEQGSTSAPRRKSKKFK